MEFGLFSQHHRPARSVADAYEEDLFEVVAADQLGYREAWISEHAFPDLRPPPATPLAGAGVAGDGFQAEGGGQLLGTEPDAARKRRPGPAVEREPGP
jgi:hypothetical protein